MRVAVASTARARPRPSPVASRRETRRRAAPERNDSLGALDALLSANAETPARANECANERANASPAMSTSRGVTRSVEVALSEDELARLELRVSSATSRLVRATMRSPLGIVFEDVDGSIVAVEFYDESELGPRGRGVRIGDVLRATSCMVPTMVYSAMNVLGGGNGKASWARKMYTTACDLDGNLDDVTFDQAMKAIASNSKAGDYDVELVFERRAE